VWPFRASNTQLTKKYALGACKSMYRAFNTVQAASHSAKAFGEVAGIALETRPNWSLVSRTQNTTKFEHFLGRQIAISHTSDSLKTVVKKVLEVETDLVLANAGADELLVASTLSVIENTVDDFFR
jgi:hypothetical protein